MVKSNVDSSSELSWQLEQGRVTLFSPVPLELSAEEIWKALSDSQPEDVSAKPLQGLSAAAGAFGDALLHVQVHTSRLDLVIAPIVTGELTNHPVVGPYPLATGRLLAHTKTWLKNNEANELFGFQRLAVGAILIRPMPNREAG